MHQEPHLRSEVALVTGAGRGIGRAIAQRLSTAGYGVAIASRTESDLEETLGMIERDGGRVAAIRADVSRVEDVKRMVEEALGKFGRIDVLVNNAGTAPNAAIEEMQPESFDQIVATNVRSVYLCSRAVWGSMARGGGGVIVNIASVAAYDPFPGFAAYGAAKAFVVAYTRGLAQEGAAQGIRVYGIAPGAVETRMLRGPFPDFPRDKVLDPDEVAALVEHVLLPACRHVSGQTIVIRKD